MTVIPKLLTVTALAAGILGVSLLSTAHSNPPVSTTPVVATPDIHSLWQDTNNERAKHGLPALVLDPKLTASATAKCADMVRLDDWNHDLNDGTTPNDYIKAQVGDIHYTYGENISGRYSGTNSVTLSQDITNGWIGSPGHEANLVNPHYTAVGYAVCQLPSYPNTVVQQFTSL